MKALLVDPKLPHSFWTFDQSLELLGKKAVNPSLSLMTVAALLPSDWELKLIDRTFQQISEDDWAWADIVLISAMAAQKEDMLTVIREAKNKNKLTVVGGPYASIRPEEPEDAGADFIVQGEAEETLPVLLEALSMGKTKGIIAEQTKPDITTSPVPRFDLADLSAYMIVSIQTSRGCPYNCEFCDISALYGKKPRHKTPDRIIAELQALYDLGRRNDVFISDDNFIGSKRHARACLERMIPWMKAHGEPFRFWTQTSVDLGQDMELIDLMTEANFGNVFIGIESPDEDALRGAHKHHNLKHPLAESIRSINANGLSVIGSFIIGFDNEKKGAGDRITELVEETHIPMVMVNLLRAMPGTMLWERLKTENRLLCEQSDGLLTIGKPNFLFDRPQEEVTQELIDATVRLYEPKAFLERTYRYYLAMRPTRKALSQNGGSKYPDVVRERPSFHEKLRNFRGLLHIIWRRGIAGNCRGLFWKQLIGMYFKNPSRLHTYVLSIGVGENLFKIREMLLSNSNGDTDRDCERWGR